MSKRSDDSYIETPWGPSDGVCRHPHNPDVDDLPESFQQSLKNDPKLATIYLVVDDSVDTDEQAYGRDLRLMRHLTFRCPGLTKSELLTVLNEFPNGLYQFSEYLTADDLCGEDTEYVEKLIRETDYHAMKDQ